MDELYLVRQLDLLDLLDLEHVSVVARMPRGGRGGRDLAARLQETLGNRSGRGRNDARSGSMAEEVLRIVVGKEGVEGTGGYIHVFETASAWGSGAKVRGFGSNLASSSHLITDTMLFSSERAGICEGHM